MLKIYACSHDYQPKLESVSMIYRKSPLSSGTNKQSSLHDRTVSSSRVRMSYGHLLDCFTGEFIITHAQWIVHYHICAVDWPICILLCDCHLNIFSVWFTIFYCDRLQIFCDIEYQSK